MSQIKENLDAVASATSDLAEVLHMIEQGYFWGGGKRQPMTVADAVRMSRDVLLKHGFSVSNEYENILTQVAIKHDMGRLTLRDAYQWWCSEGERGNLIQLADETLAAVQELDQAIEALSQQGYKGQKL